MSPRPRLSDGETAEHARRIVEATFTVVAATGDPDPPIRPILEESGLSRPAFYRCFESKEALMVVVLGEGRRILAEYLDKRMARAPESADKVRSWVTGMMRQADTSYAADRTRPFMFRSAPNDAANHELYAETEYSLCRPLQEAIATGVADGSWASTDPAADALIIHDYVLAALRRHLVLGIAPEPATTRTLGDFALRALAAPPPADPRELSE